MKNTKQIILTGIAAAFIMINASNVNAQYWNTAGSNLTSTDFIGSTTGNTQDMRFKLNNSQRMVIKSSSGNVGIGISSPSCKLHVYGSGTANLSSVGIFAIGSSASGGPQIRFDGSTIQTVLSMTLPVAGSTLSINPFGGNVGIGTSSASYKFHVENSSSARTAYFNNDYSGSSTKFGIYNVVSALGTGNKFGVYSTATDNGSADAIGLKGVSTSNTGNSYGVHGEASGATGSSSFAVRGDASGSGIGHNCYGVFGSATGSGAASNNYSVYGSETTGAANNWAGYFDNRVHTGELCVGTNNGATGYLLSVEGKVICEELKVALHANWPDYVFANDYKLMPIEEMEKSIKENKHLPGIPSACEVEENGLLIGDMQHKMMEKIEQLSLYIIDLKHQKDELANRILQLENK